MSIGYARSCVSTVSGIRPRWKKEIEQFLSWLANERGVAAATHTQDLSALLFLYGKVLDIELPWMQEIGRPREKKRSPVVLSVDEGATRAIAGRAPSAARLLYGTG